MTTIDLVPAAYWTRIGVDPDEARSYVPGPANVEMGAERWGIDNEKFTPSDYGRYIATSNGVYACSKIRAQLLSSLPLKIHRVSKSGKKTEVTSGDLYALLQKVNPFWTFSRLMDMTELSLSLWGSSFWVLDRGTTKGRPPREIWWARPDRMKVVPHPTRYIAGYLYTPISGGEEIPFAPEEVIYIRYPNPLDEFSGLSPLAAARLAADISSAAMQSNYRIFSNGVQVAGIVSPDNEAKPFSEEQAKALEEGLRRRLTGANNAHRWAVLRYQAKFQSMQMTPKDAEFLGALKWALEDICRAYGVPQDLIGGQRTYANQHDARLAIWTDTVLPESEFVAQELTEQLLPMFPGQADLIEFDPSEVPVLQEAEASKWTIEKQQIDAGVVLPNEWRTDKGLDPVPWGDAWWAPTAGGGVGPVTGNLPPIAPIQQITSGGLTLNELRKSQGLKPVPWGDVWWAPAGVSPIDDAEMPEEEPPQLPPGQEPLALTEGTEMPQESERSHSAANSRMAFGSEAHERAWRAFVDQTAPHEDAVKRMAVDLFRRQRTAVLSRLKQQRVAVPLQEIADDPFSKPRWVKQFRTAARPVLLEIVDAAGQAVPKDLGLGIGFDVADPNVVRFLERRAQRFAVEVNETTWEMLRTSLGEGLDAGEGIDDLATRVNEIMGSRIRSSAETIARTESVGAYNGGQLLSAQQSGVVSKKEWIAALDERTRPAHADAHGQTVDLDANFSVDGAEGPAPGQMGRASLDVNCRCSVLFHLDTGES